MNLPNGKEGEVVYQAKSNFASNGTELAVVEFSSSRKRASVAVKKNING